MISPGEHTLLIADPFLKDNHFTRSVVYLCSHDKEGSFGFSLNKIFEYNLNDLVENVQLPNIPIYVGGPVGNDALHFLHRYPELISDSQKISEGLYWGGNFKDVVSLIHAGHYDPNKLKFFVGYSGWGANQLQEELNDKTWLIAEADTNIVFETSCENVWKESVKKLGKDFREIINYPIDPQLN
jgi:putative transcriptional regulator